MMKRMEKKREFFGLPIMFWGLWVTLLILWMGRFVTSFLSMYLVSDMHVSAGVAGTIVSMYGFGGIFGCLYGGALSDRFGRPAMIVIGNLGSAVMLVLLAFIGNPWIMAIALLIYGAISSMPTPAVAAYVSDVVPFRKQKRAYSLQTWAANFGFAIGPIIANQLVKISYSLMFYAEAAVLVFATLLMIVFFKEAGIGGRAAKSSVKQVVEQPAEAAESQRSQQFSIWRSYRRACTDKALMSMVVLMFLYTLAYYQIVSGLPISMTQIGLGTDEYSSLLTINGGILCLLQIPAIALFQRMSNTRVLGAGHVHYRGWLCVPNRRRFVGDVRDCDRAVDARRAWHIPDCRYDGGEYRAEGCTRHVSGLVQPGVVAIQRVFAACRRLDFERVRQSRAVDLLHGDVRNCGDRLLRDARPPRTRRSPQSCDGGTVAVALRRWRAVDTPPNLPDNLT